MIMQDYYDELVNGTVESVDYSTSDINRLADNMIESHCLLVNAQTGSGKSFAVYAN